MFPSESIRIRPLSMKKYLEIFNAYFRESDIEILSGDFSKGVAKAGMGDFVYLDPPYDPLSSSASFTGYTLRGFNSGRADPPEGNLR